MGRKSAISLDALQSDMLRIGAKPIRGTEKWKLILSTSTLSLDRAVTRWLKDWHGLVMYSHMWLQSSLMHVHCTHPCVCAIFTTQA